MAKVTDKPWNGAESRWPDAASYCKSCLIDENEAGADKIKDKCYLPVYEPDGTLNSNGASAAVTYLQRVKASPASKKKAAAKLRSIYKNDLGVKEADLPETLKRM